MVMIEGWMAGKIDRGERETKKMMSIGYTQPMTDREEEEEEEEEKEDGFSPNVYSSCWKGSKRWC